MTLNECLSSIAGIRLYRKRKTFPCKWHGKPSFGKHTYIYSRKNEIKLIRRECIDAWQY